MKYIKYLLIIVFAFSIGSCRDSQPKGDILFQISTIDALLNGAYDGEMTFGELKRHGTFGLGTFDGLDGEMIGLEGKFYQIKADGIAYPVTDSMKTPFAVVTSFETDKTTSLENGTDYEQLKVYLDELIPNRNIFYAIKIKGTFKYIKARSVPRQNKLYPPLVEVVKDQTIFEFHNVSGTIVGFRCPDFIKGVNVPGYHFHFITDKRKAGGHLLACQLQKVTIAIDYTPQFYMILPQKNGAPHKSVPTTDRSEELKKVEQE